MLKNFYILSSLYIIILMTRVYARTREKEKAFKLGGFSLGASLIAAPLIALIFQKWLPRWDHHKIMVVSVFRQQLKQYEAHVSLIDVLGVFDHPRIGLRAATAPFAPSDNSPNRYRFFLPRHFRLLSGLLHSQLDGAWLGK